MEKITVDTIINFLKDAVEKKMILPPSVFLDAAEKLNILRGDEEDKLINLMQKVAQYKTEKILEGKSVAMAKVMVEATDTYKEMLIQKMRCERIVEFIRIEKIRARLKDTELSQY